MTNLTTTHEELDALDALKKEYLKHHIPHDIELKVKFHNGEEQTILIPWEKIVSFESIHNKKILPSYYGVVLEQKLVDDYYKLHSVCPKCETPRVSQI